MPESTMTIKVKLNLDEIRQQIAEVRQLLAQAGGGGQGTLGSAGSPGTPGSMAPNVASMGGVATGAMMGGIVGDAIGALTMSQVITGLPAGGHAASAATAIAGVQQMMVGTPGSSGAMAPRAPMVNPADPFDAQVADLASQTLRGAGISPSAMTSQGMTAGRLAHERAAEMLDPDIYEDDDGQIHANPYSWQRTTPGMAPQLSSGAPPRPLGGGRGGERGFAIVPNLPSVASMRGWASASGLNGTTMGAGSAAAIATAISDTTSNYIASIGTETSRTVRRIETGRAPQPWDTATEDLRSGWGEAIDVVGTGASALLAGIVSGIASGGTLAIPGGLAGGAAFHSAFQGITGAQGDQIKRENEAGYQRGRSAYGYATTVGSTQYHPNWSTQDWNAASALSIPMMSGLGGRGAGSTNLLLDEFKANNPSDPEGAADLARRVAAGLSPEQAGRAAVHGWDRDLALSIGINDQDAMVAYNAGKARSGDTAGLLQITGNVSRLRDTATGAAYGIGGAESRTEALISRGGTASQVGGARSEEISALQAAKSANDAYIASLDQVKVKTAVQTAELERAKSVSEGYTSQIAAQGLATVQGLANERTDIAGTVTSGAQSRLGRRIGTARAGDYSVYDDVLSGLSGDRAAAQANYDSATTPSDKRLYRRQMDAVDAEIWGNERQAADYRLGQPGRLASDRLGEAQAGESIATEIGSAGDIRYARSRVAIQSSRILRAAQSRLTGMESRPDLFGDEDLSNQSLEIARDRANAINAYVQGTRVPLGSMEQGQLDSMAFDVRVASRRGGVAALGVTGNLISRWTSIQNRRQIAYDANPNGATLADLNGAKTSVENLRESLGAGGLDAGTGTTLDALQSRQRIIESNMFAAPGLSRRGAAIETYHATEAARSDAQTRLNAAVDPQLKRQIAGEINQYNESLSQQQMTINDGWWNRMVNRTIGAPNRSALSNVSYRDVLLFDPSGNRHVGTASRNGYTTDEFDAQSGRTNKPGSVSNQIAGVIDVNLHLDGQRIGSTRMDVQRGMRVALDARVPG